MPWKFVWVSGLEAIFDLIVDDYYPGHPNRDALLSNDYTHIGIACNCHPRLGSICSFEMAKNPETKPIPSNPSSIPVIDNTPIEEPEVVVNECLPICTENATDIDAFRQCCWHVCHRSGR